jgi:hypothetical protein
MTTDSPQADDRASTTNGSDAIEVLESRARAAAAQRDASIADLRRVMDDQGVLAEFGIDLSRLEG